MSLPPEILKKVKLLELSTRKLVNNIFAGEYHSAFRGQGMTFSEFREYVPGDDVRNISWTLTARAGKPYIKKYDEERELTLMLAVDVSGSVDFGTGQFFKGEVMAHIAALLAFSAAKNNDQIGLLLFSDQVEHYVPPRKGRGHVHRILRDLYFHKPVSRQTKIGVALEHMRAVLKRHSHVFIISDFQDQGYAQSLRTLSKKHDVVAVVVEDKAEQNWPSLGLIDIHDAESGEMLTIDTSSSQFQKLYKAKFLERRDQMLKELQRSQVDVIDIPSSDDFTRPLIEFFKRRKTR